MGTPLDLRAGSERWQSKRRAEELGFLFIPPPLRQNPCVSHSSQQPWVLGAVTSTDEETESHRSRLCPRHSAGTGLWTLSFLTLTVANTSCFCPVGKNGLFSVVFSLQFRTLSTWAECLPLLGGLRLREWDSDSRVAWGEG